MLILRVSWKYLRFWGNKLTIGVFRLRRMELKLIRKIQRQLHQCPPLKIVRKVTTFLSLVAWFLKFILYFLHLCEQLYVLKRKRVKFVWSAAAQRSYELSKEALLSLPVLGIQNYLVWFQNWCSVSPGRSTYCVYATYMHPGFWIPLSEIIILQKLLLFGH